MELTYTSYLKADELLDLQHIQSKPEQHDELLFIIIHQTYELWFKQVLHEFQALKLHWKEDNTWNAIRTLRRILVIMKTLVGQNDILETMSPMSFKSFRDFLQSASGFQSIQFREIELLCGLRGTRMFALHQEGTPAYTQLKKRWEEETLWESFVQFLQNKGANLETPSRVNENGLAFEPSDVNQKELLKWITSNDEVNLLTELLVDLDEGLQEWRYRHVKMVERTIGNKIGTGGSDGVKYLKNTLHTMIFPDLWAVRTLL